MSHAVEVRPLAAADLTHAAIWYEDRRTGLGHVFMAAVNDILDDLRDFPRMYAVARGPYRRAVTRRFPYAVYYRIEGNTVVVVGVFHTRRHPRHWKKRLRD